MKQLTSNLPAGRLTVHSLKKSVNCQLKTVNPSTDGWRGFTLIELLIVITIIGILIGAASVSWTNAQIKSRDGKRKADLKAVQQAIEAYINVNGSYPIGLGGIGKIKCNIVDNKGTSDPADDVIVDVNSIDWGKSFICTAVDGKKVTYLSQLPKDPTGPEYYYLNPLGTSSYTICAKLENPKDQDINTAGDLCFKGTTFNYQVTNP